MGDSLVETPRRELFETWLRGNAATPQRQDALHRHEWPDRRHLSICMRRADACTVSYTTFEIREHEVALCHHGGSPDESAPATSLRLLRPASEVV